MAKQGSKAGEAAEAEAIDLGEFEGRPVTRSSLIIRKTGSGLDESLKTNPALIESGDVGALVLDWECDEVRFPRIKERGEDTGETEREHVVDAQTVTLVDRDLVASMLDAQAERNRLREEAEDGAQQRSMEQLASELRGDHTLGEHASGLVEGCTLCEEEQALKDQEESHGE